MKIEKILELSALTSVASGVRCYQCREIFDHSGNKLSENSTDENCVNLNGDKHLVNCDSIYTNCETGIRTDWLINGKQQYILERKCSDTYFTNVNATICDQS